MNAVISNINPAAIHPIYCELGEDMGGYISVFSGLVDLSKASDSGAVAEFYD